MRLGHVGYGRKSCALKGVVEYVGVLLDVAGRVMCGIPRTACSCWAGWVVRFFASWGGLRIGVFGYGRKGSVFSVRSGFLRLGTSRPDGPGQSRQVNAGRGSARHCLVRLAS